MLGIEAYDPNQLIYWCRNCGNKDNTLAGEDTTVLKTEFKQTEHKFSHFINRYTKYDPTLPRINKVLCPNTECETNTKGVPKEVVYIRYDDKNMKYIYLCSICDTAWKTDEQN